MLATNENVPLCDKVERIFDALCGQSGLLECISTLSASSEIDSLVRKLKKIVIDELGTLLAAHVKSFEKLQKAAENDRLRSALDLASLRIEECSKLLSEAAAYDDWTAIRVSKMYESWRLFCSYIKTVAVIAIEDTGKRHKFIQMSETGPSNEADSVYQSSNLSYSTSLRDSQAFLAPKMAADKRISQSSDPGSIPTIEETSLDTWRSGSFSWSKESLVQKPYGASRDLGYSSDRKIGSMFSVIQETGDSSNATAAKNHKVRCKRCLLLSSRKLTSLEHISQPH